MEIDQKSVEHESNNVKEIFKTIERQDSIVKITDKNKKKKLQIKQIYNEIILEKMKSQYNNSVFLNTETDILRINDAILVTVPGELFVSLD